MKQTDEELMIEAISLAEHCEPIADRIPRVGAVIAVDGVIIGKGHRGTGNSGDEDHAEKVALKGVVDRKQLPRATVYTTLALLYPRKYRPRPLDCCTELIRQAEVRRVFIGITTIPIRAFAEKVFGNFKAEEYQRSELFPPN